MKNLQPKMLHSQKSLILLTRSSLASCDSVGRSETSTWGNVEEFRWKDQGRKNDPGETPSRGFNKSDTDRGPHEDVTGWFRRIRLKAYNEEFHTNTRQLCQTSHSRQIC